MKISDKNKIRGMLESGPKCSGQILELFKEMYGETIVDYRARISSIRKDLKPQGLTVHSEPCRGQCGKKHDSLMYKYWIGTWDGTATFPAQPINPNMPLNSKFDVVKWNAQFKKPEVKQLNRLF